MEMEVGRYDDAQRHLHDARELAERFDNPLAAHNTRTVIMYLAAFARLASVEGDPERAALLVGAAEGLRRRVGLRTWPMLRRGAEPTTQAREALGPNRLDETFAAGSRLTQQEAVAALRDRGAGNRKS
jgi:hypothetical protein